MINDNEKSINEEESMNPTVQAVMAALNGSAGSDAGRIQRMIAAKQEAEKALAGKVSNATAEKLIQEGKDVDHAKLIANSLAATHSNFRVSSYNGDYGRAHVVHHKSDTRNFKNGEELMGPNIQLQHNRETNKVHMEMQGDFDNAPDRDEETHHPDKAHEAAHQMFKPAIDLIHTTDKKTTNEDAANRSARAIMNESFEETGEIVIDIVEENGKIVELNNGILFIEEDIPFIDIVEKYYGADYIDDLINEAIKPVFRPTVTINLGAAKTGNTKVNPKTKKIVKPTPAQLRAGAPTAPSSTVANIQKRARERNLDDIFSASNQKLADQLKATDQVMGDKIKSDFASMKPGQVKQSFLSKITGGRFGKTTFTPGDYGTLGDFDKDYSKKISDAAANIAKERELQPVQITSKRRATIDDLQPVEITSKRRGDGGADDSDASSSGRSQSSSGAAPAVGGQPSGGRAAIPIRFSLDGQEMKQSDYKKKRESGEVESQDVAFNVRNKKTGQARAIRKGDPEYDAYYSSYKKMGRAVTEALLRMGAVLTEEGWMLGEELLESVYTEYAPVEMRSPYYYDNTGRLRIMTESEWTELGLAEVILERVISEAMDDVGSEDEDVDNDGDSDSSDNYLKNRRKKIAAAIKGKK